MNYNTKPMTKFDYDYFVGEVNYMNQWDVVNVKKSGKEISSFRMRHEPTGSYVQVTMQIQGHDDKVYCIISEETNKAYYIPYDLEPKLLRRKLNNIISDLRKSNLDNNCSTRLY